VPTSSSGRAIAKTTYGTIGVKAWVYRGDVEPAPRHVAQNAPAAAARSAGPGIPSLPGAPVASGLGGGPVAPVATAPLGTP